MNAMVRKFRSLFHHARNPSGLGSAVWRNVALVRAAATGRGWFTYLSPLGVKFICFGDNSTSLQLFVKGYQEVAEVALARAWLRDGDSCIDVGANVGLLSVAFAAAVGEAGAVLSIEPSPITFARLSDAVRHLGIANVFPVACCASDSSGLTSFYVTDSGSADAEEESMRVSASRSDEFHQIVVPCATLSSLCEEHRRFQSPALLKIDVEGAEPLVLAGARNLFAGSSAPLVIAEIHREALANYGYSPSDVLRHLPADRFDRFFIPRSVSDATPDRRHGAIYFLGNDAQLPIYSNLIAVPTDAELSRGIGLRKVVDVFAGNDTTSQQLREKR